MSTLQSAERPTLVFRPGLFFAPPLLLAALLFGCSADPAPPATISHDAGKMGSGTGAAIYPIKSLSGSAGGGSVIGCGSAGVQSVAAVSGSTVAFASLAEIPCTDPAPTCPTGAGAATCSVGFWTCTCTLTILGQVTVNQIDMYNVCYSASDGGGTYTAQVVTTQPYQNSTGVGLAFDSAGNPSIAFTGVGAMPPMETCGSNDLFYTALSAGVFSAPVQLSNGSPSAGLVAAQSGDCVQNVCGEGDDTGFWPAIAFDSAGTPFMPFRDLHFGFANDDKVKSDVELAEGITGQYLTIDVSRGGGQYNRIAFTSAGLPAVLQYDQLGTVPGVWLDVQVKAGAFGAQTGAGVWEAYQVATGQIGEGLGFAISPKGLMAASYYDYTGTRLVYTSSTDGMTWTAPVTVDAGGNFSTANPSIAFDAAGNPAIAYYRCNSQGPQVGSCDVATDGLVLARLSGTTWTPTDIYTNATSNEGMYPALAFSNGKAVVAFQISSYDAIEKLTTYSWNVAEEP